MNRNVLVMACAGWALFVISFFLPAVIIIESETPGWKAAYAGIVMGPFFIADRTEPWIVLWIAQALTNVVMLTSPVALARSRRNGKRSLPWLMIVVTVMNSLPLIPGIPEPPMLVGYYVWWGSFVIVTSALILARRRGRLEIQREKAA